MTAKLPPQDNMTPSEAIYSFMAWLATRPTTLMVGKVHECSEVATLCDVYCQVNNFSAPAEDYHTKPSNTPVEDFSGEQCRAAPQTRLCPACGYDTPVPQPEAGGPQRKFFSYDPEDCGFSYHDSLSAAMDAAADALQEYSSAAVGDGWSDEVQHVAYGEMLGEVVEDERMGWEEHLVRHAGMTQEDAANSGPHQFSEFVSYTLVPVNQPEAPAKENEDSDGGTPLNPGGLSV